MVCQTTLSKQRFFDEKKEKLAEENTVKALQEAKP